MCSSSSGGSKLQPYSKAFIDKQDFLYPIRLNVFTSDFAASWPAIIIK